MKLGTSSECAFVKESLEFWRSCVGFHPRLYSSRWLALLLSSDLRNRPRPNIGLSHGILKLLIPKIA